jgi:hypothetical protein
MQDQPHLLELGMARLKLLQTFCIPSLQQQSRAGKFLWVIRTDPHLNDTLKHALQQALLGLDNDTANDNNESSSRPPPPLHHLLLASNDHPNLQVDALLETLTSHHYPEDGYSEERIWSGNVAWARNYVRAAKEEKGAPPALILETRLDADDGLHSTFVEYLDFEARHSGMMMRNSSSRRSTKSGGAAVAAATPVAVATAASPPMWKIWCASRHFEWQYQVDWKKNNQKHKHHHHHHHDDNHQEAKKEEDPVQLPPDPTVGGLVTLRLKACVSSGLTIGYTAGVRVKDLPLSMRHDTLHRHMPMCPKAASKTTTTTTEEQHPDEAAEEVVPLSWQNNVVPPSTACLQFMTLAPTLLRARTPTSAGMWNVLVGATAPVVLSIPTMMMNTTAMNTTAKTLTNAAGTTGTFHNNNNNNSTARATTTTTADATAAATTAVDKTYHKGVLHQEALQDQLWTIAKARFGLTQEAARNVHEYFAQHMQAIARENLMGQCTSGHSCKSSSRMILESILKQTTPTTTITTTTASTTGNAGGGGGGSGDATTGSSAV